MTRINELFSNVQNINEEDFPEKNSLAHLMILLCKLHYTLQLTPHRKQLSILSSAGEVLKSVTIQSSTDLTAIGVVVEWLEWKIKEPK